MHDIFAAELEGTPEAKGRVRVVAKYIDKPNAMQGLTIARSTDQSFFKASVTILGDLELLDERRDNLHHRNSGLDTTSAKLCAKHGVLVGINLANLRTLDPQIMGRVMQNIALCKKHKASMCVYTSATTVAELANPSDIESLLRVLGMDTKQVKETMQNLSRVAAAAQNHKQK